MARCLRPSKSSKERGEEAPDFGLHSWAGEFFTPGNRSDVEMFQVPLRDWLPSLECFPEDEAIDVPGEEILDAFGIGFLKSVFSQCIGIGTLAIGPVWKLDFARQYVFSRRPVKSQIPALAPDLGSFLNLGFRKRKTRIVGKNPLDCLANICCERPLVYVRHSDEPTWDWLRLLVTIGELERQSPSWLCNDGAHHLKSLSYTFLLTP